MKAVVAHPDARLAIADLPIPPFNEDEILCRTLGCAVCGTDILKLNLRLLTRPTVLGHEWVGEVLQTGASVDGFAPGDRIVAAHHVPCFDCHFCRHGAVSMCATFKRTNFVPGGFAEYVVLSGAHLKHATFKIPATMDWREALFTEPLACCVRNVNRLNLLPGDTVGIVGLGSIGLMTAALLASKGIRVIGADLDIDRRECALEYGVAQASDSTGDSFAKALQDASDGRGADGIIFTAGPAHLLEAGLSWIRDGGFLNLFSHLSGESARIDTATLYHRELRIIATYSASPDALKQSFNLLTTDALKLRRMLAPPYAPENLENAIGDVNARKILKALIAFS